MAVEDYLEPEVGVAVALTAAVASPKVRGVLRRGAVYGLAGVLMAGDAISSLARGVKRGAQSATEGATEATAPAADPGDAAPSAASNGAATESAPKRSRKPTETPANE